jgi:DNA polymerase III subunit epsilon
MPAQLRLDDLGTPLHAVTFVALDLETTGGAPGRDRITEVGAVKSRGGEIAGEFATLVDPGVAVPAGISALTGITDGMVRGQPTIEAVLPSLLEFTRGAVLVAHNARFDLSFVNAGLTALDYPRLDAPVVCTAALARRLVRDEVRDCRLATLAARFRCPTQPVHRALADARACLEVLHSLLERAGSFGVMTLEDLLGFAKVRNTPLYRARRHLADGLPRRPGVYAFRAPSHEVLYVGKATDLRARVRSYFGGDERRRIDDMLRETARVDHWVTPTPLEAEVTELRLIHEYRPRYNRRSTHPDRTVWVKLTPEAYPRLSIVRGVRRDGAAYLGPLASRRSAERVIDAIHDVTLIRRCTARIGPRTRFAACALAEMGRCEAPCEAAVSPEHYAHALAPVRDAFEGDPRELIARLAARMRALAAQDRFEEATAARTRLAAVVAAVDRCRLLTAAAEARDVVVSRPGRARDRRDLAVVREGRLVTTADCAGDDIPIRMAELRATATPEGTPHPDEILLVSRWLAGRDAVVHACEGRLASLVAGGRDLDRHGAALSRRRSIERPASALAAKRTRRGGPARSGDYTPGDDHRHRPVPSGHSRDPRDGATPG